MARTAKVAVSIEAELLLRLERVREETGESRSAAVSRAIRLLTREAERARMVEGYVRAYRDKPETLSEVTAARASAKRALSALPWDEE